MLDTESYLLLALAVYLLMAGLASLYIYGFRRAELFEPVSIFLMFYHLFVLPLPIRAYFTSDIAGDVTDHLPYLLPYIPPAVLLAAAGIPFFLVAYYASFAKSLGRRIPHPPICVRDHSTVSFLAILALALLLIYLLVRDHGGLVPFLLLGYNSTAETFGKGYLAVGFPWLIVANLFLLHKYALTGKSRHLGFCGIFLVCNLASQLITGNRGLMLYTLLALLVAFHYSVRPIRVRTLVPLAAVVFLALNSVGYLRGSGYHSMAEYWGTLAEFAGSLFSPGHDRTSLFYTLTTGEFVVPFETLPQMIKSVGNDISAWYGLSYVRSPVFFIPSAIYPDRPIPLTNWYMETFYGAHAALNEGRAFFFMAEGYLNFGLAGALMIVVLWGIGCGALWHYLNSCQRHPSAVMLYALSVAFLFRGIAGDFSSVLVGLPEQNLLIAILGLVVASGFRSWKSARHAGRQV